MFAKQYKPGDTVPKMNSVWFVILHGHVIRTVKLEYESKFPELEDTNMRYYAYG